MSKKSSTTTDKTLKDNLTEAQWWRADELEKRPDQILDHLVQLLEEDQNGRYEALREYARMFGTESDSGDELASLIKGTLEQNEMKNALESLWSQVFKNKVVPGISASEADYDEWSRAKAYSRWLEGVLDDSAVYDDAFPKAGADIMWAGTGIIKATWKEDWDDDKVAHPCAHRVNPKCVMVDRLEGKDGKPRSFFEKMGVDRWVLYDTYKDDDDSFYKGKEQRKRGILKCRSNDDEDLGITTANMGRCDMVTVREAWHLPSGPRAGDGRHVIWIKGCTLVDEEFTWDKFPFVFMRYGTATEGFWGESPVKRLAPSQKQLDKLNQKLDEAQDIMGVPRIVTQIDNLPVEAELDDVPGGIIQVRNINAIKEWNAQCATPELYNDRDSLPRKMRSLLGLSDFDVQSQIPQGMRDVSGAMLERWVDQGPNRHSMLHKQYEKAVIDLSDLFMRIAEECQEDGYKLLVNAPTSYKKTSLERLDFKDVMLDRKQLKLVVQPMSDLPQTFAGKVDAITKLLNDAKLPINPKTALRMVQIPDLQSTEDMLVSDEEIIMKNLCHMCKTGKYLSPLPYDNHALIIQLTTQFINTYRVKNDSTDYVVSLLSKYIDDAVNMQKGLGGADQNAPPPPINPMVAGLPPGAMPSPGGPMAPMGPQGPMPPPAPGGMPMGPPPGPPGPMPPQM